MQAVWRCRPFPLLEGKGQQNHRCFGVQAVQVSFRLKKIQSYKNWHNVIELCFNFLDLELATKTAMDDAYFDEYDYYNFGTGFDKMTKSGGTGHAKSKDKKQSMKYFPSGNVRTVVTNMQNAEKKLKRSRLRMNSV